MATLAAMTAQVKATLLALTWPASTNKVFGTGSVVVSRYIPEEVLRTMRVPIAHVMLAEIASDPQFDEEPDLWRVRFIVRLYNAIPGDASGENAILGANRPDTTKSEGAGVISLEAVLYTALGRLNVADSANFAIQFRQKGGSGGLHIDNKTYWFYQDLEFEAWATPN